VQVTVAAISGDPTNVAIGPTQGVLSVEKASISLASLSLLPCSTDPVAPSPYWIVDLVHEPPAQTMIATSLREFCGVRAMLAPAATGSDVPADVAGRSAFLSGKRADGTAFEIVSTAQATIDLRSTAPTGPLTTRSVFLSFDVNRWLRGLGLDRVGRNAQGVVLIDATTQPSLSATFDQQSAAAAALHDDANANGRLDPSETPPIASAASATSDGGTSASTDAAE
jgi:hypothetical protein